MASDENDLFEPELDEDRWDRAEKIERDKVEEISDGLYRTRLPTAGGFGSEWDDLAWFQKQGLRFTDFRLAKVDFQCAKSSVVRFQATYSRLDNPATRVTLPPRGSERGNRKWTLELSPDEHINYVWTYYRGESVDEPKYRGPRWTNTEDKVIEYIGLKTNHERFTNNRQPYSELPLFGHEYTCHTNSGFVVAGFWGRSGKSLTKLGVYLRVASPDSDPNRFRRAARMLLLAHGRHAAALGRLEPASGCGLGALPRSLVLQIVENLKAEEAAEYSSMRNWRSPVKDMYTQNRGDIICELPF